MTANRTRHPLYATWVHMRARCHNPNHRNFKQYGGRGIRVCDKWFEDFIAFAGDMGPRPFPSATVERVDNDGPYSPDNCRWATKTEQARNTRKNRFFKFEGKTMPLCAIAELTGLYESTIRRRIQAGWAAKDIFRPALSREECGRRGSSFSHRRRHVLYHDELMSVRELGRRTGIGSSLLAYHIRQRGRSPEDAVALVLANRAPNEPTA